MSTNGHEWGARVVGWAAMRRLGRILLNGVTILTLLLCLAFAALWVRGYWHWDAFGWARVPGSGAEFCFLQIISAGGGMTVSVGHPTSEVVTADG
jgi:hypothetical protein